MSNSFSTGLGEIHIDSSVLARYAGAAAVECVGVVGMASVSMKDGLAKLLRVENLDHGVTVTVNDNDTIEIECHIIVAYGVNIQSVCNNLCETVTYNLEKFSGMKVAGVSIYVDGVRVID